MRGQTGLEPGCDKKGGERIEADKAGLGISAGPGQPAGLWPQGAQKIKALASFDKHMIFAARKGGGAGPALAPLGADIGDANIVLRQARSQAQGCAVDRLQSGGHDHVFTAVAHQPVLGLGP